MRAEVRYEGDTLWMSQRQMADLFGVEVPTVIHHLKEIFGTGELVEEATTRKFQVVRTEGNRSVSREIAHYNLDAIISVYLDHAENQAARRIPMKMSDWVQKLDAFLSFNEYGVLSSTGAVSAAVAKRLAEEQYAQFRIAQDRTFTSDFEKETKRITGRRKK